MCRVVVCFLQISHCHSQFYIFHSIENFNSFSDVYRGFKAGTTTDWRNAFNNCPPEYQLASFRIVKSNTISITAHFWLSNTRRWTRMIGKQMKEIYLHWTSASQLNTILFFFVEFVSNDIMFLYYEIIIMVTNCKNICWFVCLHTNNHTKHSL